MNHSGRGPMADYVEDDFERDTDYIEDRITRDGATAGRSSRTATGSSSRGPARGRTARSSCAGCSASRTSLGMGVCGPDPRRAQLDLRPRPRRARPGARHRAAPGGVPGPVPRLPQGHHGPGDRRRADRPGRHQRLPADDPRPVAGVDRAPPRRRPRPLPRGAARRDRRGQRLGLHRREQRRLPLRVRRPAGVVRARLRPAVRRAGPARGAADRPPLPRRRPRSPRPTYGCSRPWCASTPSTTATSRPTATSSSRCRRCGATPGTCSRRPGFGDTVDFEHIKRHYYVVHKDINPTRIVPKGPDLTGWLTPHGREALGGRPFGDGTPPAAPREDEVVPEEHRAA